MTAIDLAPTRTWITAADGRELAAQRFPGTTGDVAVIASATGVPQGYYAAFARAVAAAGPTVLTFDYRGIGGSRPRHPRDEDVAMRDWGQLDIEGALRHADGLATDRVLWVGQSAGACFLPLAPSHGRVDRLMTVSALSGYWRLMIPRERLKLLVGWYLVFPAIVAAAGYAPRQVWGGESLPAGVMRDWGRWCRDPDYLFGDDTLDSRGFATVSAPILAVRATDDPWATPAAHAALHDRFTGTEVERRDVTPHELGVPRIGHVDLLRRSVGEVAWPGLIAWLLRR